GRPRREFLHVADAADATIFAATHYSGERHLNVGTGEDISIAELVGLISEVVGWRGRPVFDPLKPDGTMMKRLDVSRMTALGWSHSIGLRQGIELTYRAFLSEGYHHRPSPVAARSRA